MTEARLGSTRCCYVERTRRAGTICGEDRAGANRAKVSWVIGTFGDEDGCRGRYNEAMMAHTLQTCVTARLTSPRAVRLSEIPVAQDGCPRQLTAMAPPPCGLRWAVRLSAVRRYPQRRLLAPPGG
jgi:hypothetical protein